PPAHFRVESRSSSLAAAVSPSLPAPVYESAPAPQLLPLTLSKTAANFSQRFRTTLPLFLMDGIGFFLSLLVSQFCASLFLTGLVAIPPVSSQLLFQAAAFVLVYGLLGLY